MNFRRSVKLMKSSWNVKKKKNLRWNSDNWKDVVGSKYHIRQHQQQKEVEVCCCCEEGSRETIIKSEVNKQKEEK